MLVANHCTAIKKMTQCATQRSLIELPLLVTKKMIVGKTLAGIANCYYNFLIFILLTYCKFFKLK